MNKHLLSGALLALATPFLASAACPAGKTGATVLDNVSRVISFSGGIGIVNFTPGGFLNGKLTVNTTATSVLRHLPVSGRWMFDGNCENGMIWINSGQFRLATQYVTVSATGVIGYGSIPVIYQQVPPPGNMPMPPKPVSNVGDRITFYGEPIKSCPAWTAGNPLNSVVGVYTYVATGEPNGAFRAYLTSPYSGALTIDRGLLAPNQIPAAPSDGTIRINYMASPPVELLRTDYLTYGRFTSESDCTGGELLMMLNGYPRQYEFLWTDDKLIRLIGISDLPGNTNTITADFVGF